MLGLRYIMFITETKATELSKGIDVSVQFINDWVKKRKPIPAKHLPSLSEYFSLEEGYFTKDLTLKDKLEIDKQVLTFEDNLTESDLVEIEKITQVQLQS